MTKYKIQYNYDTGDSFKTEQGLTGILNFTWENLDIAKENLQRIKEHYNFYQVNNNTNWPEFIADKKRYETKDESNIRIENIKNNARTKDWYDGKYDFYLKLKMDDGIFYTTHPEWCGYFETLNYVEIISDSLDMKIEF